MTNRKKGEGFVHIPQRLPPPLSFPLAVPPRDCRCDGGRERERLWEKKEKERLQEANPVPLTTNQSGGVLRCLGGNRGGRERRR